MRMTYELRRANGWFVSAVLGFASLCAASNSGTITGTVRDADGKPLSGAHITMTIRQVPPATLETTTGLSGEYRFTGLGAGEYLITADSLGYISNAPITARITLDATLATADIRLIRILQEGAQTAAALSHPKLEFEASGIRGLIDPGGYSASSAGAASGLLRGIADVKRTGKGTHESAAKAWPCALETKLRQAVETDPKSADSNRRLGQFYTAHDEPAKAIPLLKQVLAIDPHDELGSHELAMAWLESGNFENAKELLGPLADLPAGHPADTEVHQLLARADEGLGQFQEAAQQYRLAAAEEPSEESLFGVGYELLLAGSLAQGLDAFVAGVQRYPRSIPLRIGLGTTQFLQGKTAEAVHSFLDATDIDPADSRPYPFVAGILGLAKDESDRVSSSFRRFLDRRPDSASANYFYALGLSLGSDNPDGSPIVSLLKRAIQLDPNLAKAHLLLADTLVQRANYEDAAPEYEAAIRLDNSLNDAHYRLALTYKHIGKAELSAREMQIFRLAKQPRAIGTEGVDLAQFISVISTHDQTSSQELQCPAALR